MKPRTRRALLWTFGVLGGLYVLYLVLANALIAFGGLEKIFNSGHDVHVTLGPSYSLWPGHAVTKNSVVRIEDKNVECQIVVPRAEVRWSPWAFFTKTVRLTRVRASGVAFAFLHKVDALGGEVTTRRLQAFPSIEGATSPPMRTPPPPAEGEEQRLWTIRLDDVEASATELWFMEFRYRGDAEARGGFRLDPGKRFWLTPSTLDLRGGTITVSDRKFASEVRGQIGASVPDFDVRVPQGADVLRQVDARVAVTAHLHDGLFGFYGAPVASTTTELALAVDVTTHQGRLEPGSAFKLEGRSGVAAESFALAADLSAELRATEGEIVTASIDVPRGDLALGAEEPRLAVPVERAHFDMTGRLRDLATPLTLDSARAQVRVGDTNLARLGSWMGDDSRVQGQASADLAATWSQAKAQARVDAKVRDLGFARGKLRVGAHGSLAATMESTSPFTAGHIDRLQVRLPQVVVIVDGARTLAAVQIASARTNWTAAPFRMRGDISLHVSNAAAIATGLRLASPLLGPVVESLAAATPLDARGAFDASSRAAQVTIAQAKAGILSGQGTLTLVPTPTARLRVSLGGITTDLAYQHGAWQWGAPAAGGGTRIRGIW